MDAIKYNNRKVILSSQYFLYFGVMGVFLPYFNLYCFHLGFSSFQIGTLSAIRSAIMILFSLFWGIMADKYRIRRPIYILCNLLSAFLWLFFLYIANFKSMIVITICYGIFYSPIISFLEAFSMDLLGDNKKSYGRIRAWGSLAFISMVTITGKIIDLYAIEIILGLILFGSILQALIAMKIPRLAIHRQKKTSRSARPPIQGRIVIFLISACLMLISHGAYYAFFSIHLEKLGYGNTFIGITWAIASMAEFALMVNSDKIFKRFSFEKVLIFSFFIAALRWLSLCYVKSWIGLCLSQITHAVTYGTFHMASILYIDSLTPLESKTFGQSLNNAVTYGLGLMLGFFLSGFLYEKGGATVIFGASALIALLGGLLFCARDFTLVRGKQAKSNI